MPLSAKAGDRSPVRLGLILGHVSIDRGFPVGCASICNSEEGYTWKGRVEQ